MAAEVPASLCAEGVGWCEGRRSCAPIGEDPDVAEASELPIRTYRNEPCKARWIVGTEAQFLHTEGGRTAS